MDTSSEKAPTAVEDFDSSKPSTLRNSDGIVSDNNNVKETEDVAPAMTDDQYPHGFTLALLAGASIVAVFLIALDQVSEIKFIPSESLVNPMTI